MDRWISIYNKASVSTYKTKYSGRVGGIAIYSTVKFDMAIWLT